jgi:hypothetical protein
MVSRPASLHVSRFHLLRFVCFLCPVFCFKVVENSLPQNTDFGAIVASVFEVKMVRLGYGAGIKADLDLQELTSKEI